MAKVALFHRVKFKNGHGENEKIYAAQRGDDLYELETNETKIEGINCLQWHEVIVCARSTDIAFEVRSLGLTIEEGDIGYEYLSNQFRPTVNAANDFKNGNS